MIEVKGGMWEREWWFFIYNCIGHCDLIFWLLYLTQKYSNFIYFNFSPFLAFPFLSFLDIPWCSLAIVCLPGCDDLPWALVLCLALTPPCCCLPTSRAHSCSFILSPCCDNTPRTWNLLRSKQQNMGAFWRQISVDITEDVGFSPCPVLTST